MDQLVTTYPALTYIHIQYSASQQCAWILHGHPRFVDKLCQGQCNARWHHITGFILNVDTMSISVLSLQYYFEDLAVDLK